MNACMYVCIMYVCMYVLCMYASYIICTLGAIFWGARHVQSHALCWVCSSNAGLGRSLGVLWSARGVGCLGSSMSR